MLHTGLHRPVKLYTTPLSVHVEDVTVVTSLLSNGSAVLHYEVDVYTSSSNSVELQLSLNKRQGGSVVEASLQLSGCQQTGGCVVSGEGQLVVETPRLWWPWTMNEDYGYLYTLQVSTDTLYIHLCYMYMNMQSYLPVFIIVSS